MRYRLGINKPAVTSTGRRRPPLCRPGNVLVEFGLVVLLLYALISATLAFGQILWTVQVVQQAGDLMAREMSRTPLAADITFENALDDAQVRARVYDDRFLVIDISAWIAAPGGLTLLQYLDATFPAMPVVNRALLPVMFIQDVPTAAGGGGTITALRYPGALVDVTGAANPAYGPVLAAGYCGYIVEVPVVVARTAPSGVETVNWSPVVEEIDSGNDPFRISSAAGGLAAIRFYFPSQSATLVMNKTGYGTIAADDPGVTQNNAPTSGGAATDPNDPGGVHAGQFGLGGRYAQSNTVRPFSKLLTLQAIYRREVFQ